MNDNLSIADIAVLKSEVAGLHLAINEVSAKMDLVLSMRVELSVQGERLEHATLELGRTRDAMNKEIGILEQRADTQMTATQDTRKRLDAWLNRGLGASVTLSIVFGLIQYFVLEKVDSLNSLSSLVAQNSAKIELILRAGKFDKGTAHSHDETGDVEESGNE